MWDCFLRKDAGDVNYSLFFIDLLYSTRKERYQGQFISFSIFKARVGLLSDQQFFELITLCLIQMAQQYYAENYSIRCLAGDGGQAQAFLCMRQDTFYIVKIYLNPLKADQYYNKEVEVLAKINSERIIKLIEHYPSGRVLTWQNPIEELKPFIIMEFAQHGELFKIVRSERLSAEVCRTYFKQLVEAIAHLSEKEIAHRDIKLQNLLLDKHFNLKLADFGMARDSKGEQNDFYLHSWLGSPGYMAPQIHQKIYKGEKLDLFASGIVLFIMMVRIPPFENTTITNIKYNLIRQGKYEEFWAMFEKGPRKYPLPFKRLINALLSADPQQRPTLDKLSQDEWLSGPTLSSQQLIAQMTPKYARLQIRDEGTRNLRAQMREDLARIVANYDNEIIEERERSRENGGRLEGQVNCHIFDEFLSIELQSSSLAEDHIYSIPYVKASPKEILCWLKSYLIEATKNKQVFLPENLGDIEPLEHSLQVTADGEVKLQMNFETEEGASISQTTLNLSGRFVRWGSEISLHWKGASGHEFWLGGVTSELYANLQLFFN